MAASLVQLTLLMITVIQLTSSHSTEEIIRANNEMLTQLKTAVSGLVSSNAQLQLTALHLTTAVSQLQRDIIEVKTEGRARGKLCYFGSEYNFNLNFNFKLVRRL